MNWQLQAFDSEDFIKNYWQKKPCLFKQAFVDLKSPVTPEELAGLACEEEVYSRMVLEKGEEGPWQPHYGPFTESDFLSLPESHYSFLVSECEKWIPEFAELLELFRFIPRWRVDDVMVSYAPTGGSVGPHTDEYDVFLIQLYGHRNWKYTNQRVDNPVLLPGLDLAIMQDFKADQDHILEPGDMLYLPPGVAHHGIAVDSCMTCSVGFRAPTAIETLESFTQEIDARDIGIHRYSDTNLEVGRHSGEITKAEIERFRQMTTKLLDQPVDIWIDAVAKLLTDTVANEESPASKVSNIEELLQETWVANTESRFLYHRHATSIRFYCNAQLTLLADTPCALEFVQYLCDGYQVDPSFVKSYAQEVELMDLLISLVNNGMIVAMLDN
ncbi:MAG: cupin domain-containing protein [Gammaproteobacteria bacterium]|nr:cupin domain-containing protein [Gammaproteobacteria bacterium]